MSTRQLVLDTETTGLETSAGHRIIEIGCVEMVRRRLTGNNYHVYIQPDRMVDADAVAVHGIDNEFLQDKPRFAEILPSLIDYLRGAELIIHNSKFDVGFLNHEFQLAGIPERIEDLCQVTDTLSMARGKFPGQRNSLDALCKRLEIDNSHRTLHGALLDSEILADVYLRMTGGQVALSLSLSREEAAAQAGQAQRAPLELAQPLRVQAASAAEREAHEQYLAFLAEQGRCRWTELAGE